MKKIIIWLVFSSLVFGIAKNNKFDLLTNFNNFKKYKMDYTEDIYTNWFPVSSSKKTNGIISSTIEAIFFKEEEGNLEKLTKSQIDELSESPYKFLQLDNYASETATDFDRDMAFLYHSEKQKEAAKKIALQYKENYYKALRNTKNKKLLAAVRYTGNKIFLFCEQEYAHKDHIMNRYSFEMIAKKDGKWARDGRSISIEMRLIYAWLMISFERQRNGRMSRSGSSDKNAIFFDAFEEIK